MASGVKVHWTIAGGTAVAGIDFTGPTSGWVTFGFQQMTQSIPIQILVRSGAQGPRSIKLLLDDTDGGGTLGARPP